MIVDDEELCRRGIRLLLSQANDFEVVAECSNGREAIAKIRELKPDLVFLDIQMPEISGFDVLAELEAHELPFVIFVTAYDEYAVRAFEVHALDYILKPFSKKRFMGAVERARASLVDREIRNYGEALVSLLGDLKPASREHSIAGGTESLPGADQFLIKDKGSYKFVKTENILYVEGADYYANIVCDKKAYLFRGSLKNIEKKLPASRFHRIHKSTIVNINKIREIRNDYKNDLVVVLESGKELKVSRRRRKELMASWEARFGLGG